MAISNSRYILTSTESKELYSPPSLSERAEIFLQKKEDLLEMVQKKLRLRVAQLEL